MCARHTDGGRQSRDEREEDKPHVFFFFFVIHAHSSHSSPGFVFTCRIAVIGAHRREVGE